MSNESRNLLVSDRSSTSPSAFVVMIVITLVARFLYKALVLALYVEQLIVSSAVLACTFTMSLITSFE